MDNESSPGVKRPELFVKHSPNLEPRL